PIKNIIKAADKYDINKFIILNPDQANFLFESEIEFDEFVFSTQLEKELSIRIKLNLLKHNIFPPKNSIVIDRLILNLDKYELSINGKPVELTFKELELFKILLQNQNKVFTRNKLLSTVWEYDFYGGSRTVDVHMRRLRSKIPSPYNLMLKTVRNVGYMFSPQI
ncbi:MAG: winged helix-turn-helix domain-containing protein, partial [Actinobacteria bacterium]|nr:winged helix-turn-helix domain-containing protein [Actinomycetota bacterium]